MKLYDECITQIEQLMQECAGKRMDGMNETGWPDVGVNQLVFRQDMAYELGGDRLSAVSGILPTDSKELVPGDEIWLLGNDLSEIKADTPYARIALIRVNNQNMSDANAQYQAIRKIEYTRYHLNPKGFMMRVSAMKRREAVRISKDALEEGLNFSKVGEVFLQAYHKHPQVEAVKLIFITQPDFPYAKLSSVVEKSENITKTLDHLTKKVKMDCNVCKLQDVCAQVEELYQSELAENQ